MRKAPDDAKLRELLEAAGEATKNAYAPYSKFKVGSAILTKSGEVFTGCNVENSSFGLTMCAERNAMFQAVARGHKRFKAVAIVADGDAMPYPCGACRQVMAEFCGPDCVIVVAPLQNLDDYDKSSLEMLLAKTFTLTRAPEDDE
jgi:cytidine deaminase